MAPPTSTRRNSFVCNGSAIAIDSTDSALQTNLTLSRFLRRRGLTGTKEGCAEGDCGACSVLVSDIDSAGHPTWRSTCACITFLPMVFDREVVTVEGLASGPTLHPVQAEMIEHGGNQCGYCTPGFCIAMAAEHAQQHASGVVDAQLACRNLDGNLCRCTGYRPLRDAMHAALAQASTTLPSRPRLPVLQPLDVVGASASAPRFLRPTSVQELLHLRAQHADAQLVGGATELGVLFTKRHTSFPLLLSTEGVRALSTITDAGSYWEVGGAATLTTLDEVVGAQVPALRKMLRVFASRQIRNRATLAGNIVTASPIGDLPPLLLVLDAVVVCSCVSGERRVPIAEFFVGYRKTALRADEVVTAVQLPKPPAAARLHSYKVSKRRELDISAVAACMCVHTDDNDVITHARVAYGGVAATPVRVDSAERALVGRTLAASWQDAAAAVRASLTPLTDARGSAHYRTELAVRLLEKFARGVTSEAQDDDIEFAIEAPWPQLDASRSLRHDSARGHVTGDALYVDDIAERRGMLEMWPVLSKLACGTITRIDTTAAKAMPGVVCVLTAAEIPGDNDVGAIRKDEVLLAHDVVSFHKQPIAVVVADTVEHARQAAEAVVVQIAARPPILGIDAAIEAHSFHTAAHVIARGDVDSALKIAHRSLKGTVRIGGQEHFYLETHAAFAEPGDDGDVHVVSSTQHPSEIQAAVSHVLNIPRHQVVVTAPRMGGGFGGKETQGNAWAALVALAAMTTRKPVRIMLDRDIDIEVTGKRHPFMVMFDVGFAADGVVTALDARVFSDGGWALDLSESINDRALFHLDNAYHIANIRMTGRVVKTNVVSHTAFRGFGGPQGMLVIEEVLSRVAHALKLPADVVRERNFYPARGGTTPYGQAVDDNRIPKMWQLLKDSAHYAQRRAHVDAHNANHPDVKRGLAITPVKFGISFTASFLNQAGALVHIYRDGSVQVNHGGTEMGQGLHTKVIGMVMRALGVSRHRVRVMKTATDKVPNTSATAASAGTDLNGAAVSLAVETLLARLRPIAASLLSTRAVREVDGSDVQFRDDCAWAHGAQVTFAEVCAAAYLQQVSLSSTGFYRTPDVNYDRSIGRGKPFHYFAYGACVAEVELDALSGMKRVRRVDILHDVGDSLNAQIDRGQVEGAFMQGVGWLTSEELLWDADGKLLTHSASTVQIPSMGDAPGVFIVRLLDDVVAQGDATQHDVVHGSKAVGEPPLMLALAVREALRDAVLAFGGPCAMDSPLTHERLLSLLTR